MKIGWKAQRRWRSWVRRAGLALTLMIFGLPLVWTALASFGLQPDDSTWPPSWTLPPSVKHYVEIGISEPAFWQELATSFGLSTSATGLTVAIAFLAAYGLARSSFRGKRLVTHGFLILASLPVMAYVIPLSDVMRRLHLTDTLPGLVLAESAINAPLAVYVLQGYLSLLSREWEEAARLDGAGLGELLWQIVLPAALPGVAATATILFVLNWNLFLAPLVLTATQVKTIPVAMSDFFTFERELEWPTAAAALLVSLLPLAALAAAAHQLLDQFSLAPVQLAGRVSNS